MTPTITRLHGGVEMRFPTRVGGMSGDVVLFLPDGDAIDLGQRLVGAVLGGTPAQPVASPPLAGDDPGDSDG